MGSAGNLGKPRSKPQGDASLKSGIRNANANHTEILTL